VGVKVDQARRDHQPVEIHDSFAVCAAELAAIADDPSRLEH
jgi:hypothetical protein